MKEKYEWETRPKEVHQSVTAFAPCTTSAIAHREVAIEVHQPVRVFAPCTSAIGHREIAS